MDSDTYTEIVVLLIYLQTLKYAVVFLRALIAYG